MSKNPYGTTVPHAMARFMLANPRVFISKRLINQYITPHLEYQESYLSRLKGLVNELYVKNDIPCQLVSVNTGRKTHIGEHSWLVLLPTEVLQKEVNLPPVWDEDLPYLTFDEQERYDG